MDAAAELIMNARREQKQARAAQDIRAEEFWTETLNRLFDQYMEENSRNANS